ncbi:hypothetical protein IEQ11_18635 [Lysobacter capsici]|uniref:hypothetical protein n=1 Tax=Lysobacter capsici TaxID=435897 RepID=UPI001FF2E9EE|nr:hypothetical protein [Lysobacter capsici]UOF13741.1 hypothetical protein IEQ11_18635 [Lysobacter capsici]
MEIEPAQAEARAAFGRIETQRQQRRADDDHRARASVRARIGQVDADGFVQAAAVIGVQARRDDRAVVDVEIHRHQIPAGRRQRAVLRRPHLELRIVTLGYVARPRAGRLRLFQQLLQRHQRPRLTWPM